MAFLLLRLSTGRRTQRERERAASAGRAVDIGHPRRAPGRRQLGAICTSDTEEGYRSGPWCHLLRICHALRRHRGASLGSSQIAFIDTPNPSWALTAQTGSGFGIGDLHDVSCWSTTKTTPSCALLGDAATAPDTVQPLSAFLTGTKWTIVPTV